ncbi:MAG: DNA gyrase subunit A [Candidatus Margulisbacteria bacterium]|nr:DNA gyrase subunit A [Candidatus Margulisiibacteriota bacterium]
MQEDLFTTINIKPVNIEVEMKASYIDYAMSVIVGRALPDVRDGLKPVHRRILYAMYEQGITHDKSYKKSARVVGEVLGKYHPHGDTAVYDSMVRMAQEFSLRYPMIDGQGNFGSVDGDSAAAMRYTEARMSKIAAEMLADIEKNTVEFTPNFDESLSEPAVLPSKLPSLLINGSSGIAVGMATNIPPHNITEVLNGLLALIDNPEITPMQLMGFIKGPDFPTGGIIRGQKGIIEAYTTGKGIIKLQAKYHIEEVKSKKRKAIIVTEIPYTVNKAQLIIKIADLVKEKVFNGIADLRDESDRKGMRIYIELKKEANEDIVLNLLMKHTSLFMSYGINIVALDNGQPKQLNLKEMLVKFLEHRFIVVKRAVEFDLNKAQARAHILEGLRIALNNLDEVIELIRASATGAEARDALVVRFGLSEIQAQAILDMKLQRLTGLEREKIEIEYNDLMEKIKDMMDILSKKSRLLDIIKADCFYLKEKFGDERKTEIAEGLEDINIEDLIQEEKVAVFFTKFGFVKRLAVDTFRNQLRGGRGIGGMVTREGDIIEKVVITSTHSYLVCFTSEGKAYKTKVYNIPEESRYSKGSSIKNVLNIKEEEKVTTGVVIENFDVDDQYLLMTTVHGVVKRSKVSDFKNIRTTGIIAINLDEGDELRWVEITNGKMDVLMVSSNGMVIRFDEEQVRSVGRTARGVRGMKLRANDIIVGNSIIDPDAEKESLLMIASTGTGKRTQVSNFRVQNRAGIGVIGIKLKVDDKLAGGLVVQPDDEVIIVSSKGTVSRQSVKLISSQGRAARGVKVQKLDGGDTVVAFAKLLEDDGEESQV